MLCRPHNKGPCPLHLSRSAPWASGATGLSRSGALPAPKGGTRLTLASPGAAGRLQKWESVCGRGLGGDLWDPALRSGQGLDTWRTGPEGAGLPPEPRLLNRPPAPPATGTPWAGHTTVQAGPGPSPAGRIGLPSHQGSCTWQVGSSPGQGRRDSCHRQRALCSLQALGAPTQSPPRWGNPRAHAGWGWGTGGASREGCRPDASPPAQARVGGWSSAPLGAGQGGQAS